MKILIVSDFHAFRFCGELYIGTQYSTIVKRYKQAFGDIYCCLRVTDVDVLPSGCECVEHLFPYYGVTSLRDAFSKQYISTVKEILLQSNLLVIRCPSLLGIKAAVLAKEMGKPYMTEVMGDAWDAYWYHSFIGKLLAPFFYSETKKCIAGGNYALYVTRDFLQKRYPCSGLTVSASNVLLENVDGNALQRRLISYSSTTQLKSEITLMTTGAVDVAAKGQRYVIKAIPALNRKGIKVKYYIVGGGDNRYLLNLAKKLGVLSQVNFLGRQPLNHVFELLDSVDIYIQPSLQEGLPRSVIEAMSKGCLVIGSETAGTPELVQTDCLVRKRNVKDIVNKIIYIHKLSSEKKAEISKRNFEKSKEYLCDILDERRNNFYKQIYNDISLSMIR